MLCCFTPCLPDYYSPSLRAMLSLMMQPPIAYSSPLLLTLLPLSFRFFFAFTDYFA